MIQKPSTGQGVTRTPRTIALSKGIGSKLEKEDGLCTHCGVPENTPGHSGHYENNVEPSRMQGSTRAGPQGKNTIKLGGG